MPAVARSLGPDALRHLPWWKSLWILNENKGAFGLNMLHWWDRERNVERIPGRWSSCWSGRPRAVVAQSFPFDRAGEAHTFIAERCNIGKVVLVPEASPLEAALIPIFRGYDDRMSQG